MIKYMKWWTSTNKCDHNIQQHSFSKIFQLKNSNGTLKKKQQQTNTQSGHDKKKRTLIEELSWTDIVTRIRARSYSLNRSLIFHLITVLGHHTLSKTIKTNLLLYYLLYVNYNALLLKALQMKTKHKFF